MTFWIVFNKANESAFNIIWSSYYLEGNLRNIWSIGIESVDSVYFKLYNGKLVDRFVYVFAYVFAYVFVYFFVYVFDGILFT